MWEDSKQAYTNKHGRGMGASGRFSVCVCEGNQRDEKQDIKYKRVLTLIRSTWMMWSNLCKIVCVFVCVQNYTLRDNDERIIIK